MEKTQTGHSRAGRRSDLELGGVKQGVAPLGLHYLTPREFHAHQARLKGKVLGAIAFGSVRPPAPSIDGLLAWVKMPVLGGDPVFEVWTSDTPVVHEDAGDVTGARNENVLFGCLQVEGGDRLDSSAYLAYSRIFDFIDQRGYGYLLRVWNYFPGINDDDAGGLERYRRFSIGRHDAFVAKGRVIGQKDVPAACALGTQGGPMVIYFLAARKSGQLLENPRQTSAYHYPAEYGPRSPTFSRGLLMQTGERSPLFVSGTASIVGHETLHVGDTVAQVKETLSNIRTVLKEASRFGWGPTDVGPHLHLKTYLRRPDDLPIVQAHLLQAFGPEAKVIYLQADICRSDLLLEVEGACLRNLKQPEPLA